MKILIIIILILSSCTEVKIPKIKLKIKKQEDTLNISEKQGLKQIKFLDSLHKIGKF